MISFLFYLTIVLFILVCIFLILLILIQKGRGGGLASAFGGGAGGHTAFGSKTGDVLTWATSVVFGVFVILAVALNLFSNARAKQTANANPSVGRPPTQAPAGPGPLNNPATPDPGLGAGTPPVERPTTQP